MKKLILFLIIIIIISPIMVYAIDSCDSKDIEIESVELKKLTGNAVEGESAKIENGKLITNLSFATVGDSVQYKLRINNKSNEDYYFDEKSIKSKTEYIDYEVFYDDNNSIVKKKSSKVVNVKISYSREISDNVYHSDYSMIINLTNEDLNIPNPNTSNKLIIFMLFVLMILVISGVVFRNKRISKALLVLFILLVPVSVYALCKVELDMKCNISIEKKYTGYSYFYNERGASTLGYELNIHRKSVWCPIDSSGSDESACALGDGFETEEECRNYIDQYYNGGSCVSRERLYDDSIIFHEINPIEYFYESARMYYIKMYIEDNVVKDAWVCFRTDKDYCMKGGDGTQSYNTNLEILRAQEPYFTSCEYGEEYSSCQGGIPGLKYISIHKEGMVTIGNNYQAGCYINADGYFTVFD